MWEGDWPESRASEGCGPGRGARMSGHPGWKALVPDLAHTRGNWERGLSGKFSQMEVEGVLGAVEGDGNNHHGNCTSWLMALSYCRRLAGWAGQV